MSRGNGHVQRAVLATLAEYTGDPWGTPGVTIYQLACFTYGRNDANPPTPSQLRAVQRAVKTLGRQVYTRKGSLGFKIDNRPVPGLIVWRAPTSDELAVALLAVTSNSTLKETRAYLAEHPDKAQELHDMFAE